MDDGEVFKPKTKYIGMNAMKQKSKMVIYQVFPRWFGNFEPFSRAEWRPAGEWGR